MPTQHKCSKDTVNRKNACVWCKNLYYVRVRIIVHKGKVVYVYTLVSWFIMYICNGVAYITTMSLDFWNSWSKIIFPELSFFRGGRCNVRNIDLLVVALDEPECAGEESLTQLENTGQHFVYSFLLFKVCALQKFFCI